LYIDLDNALKEVSKKHVKIKTQADLKASSIKEEEANRTSILEGQREAANALQLAQQKSKQVLDTFAQIKEQHERLADSLKKKEELLQTLSTGMAAEEGKDSGFMDQLAGMSPPSCTNLGSGKGSNYEQREQSVAKQTQTQKLGKATKGNGSQGSQS